MAGRRKHGVGGNRFQEPLDNDDVRRSLEMLDDVLAQFDEAHQRQPQQPNVNADSATIPRTRSRRTTDANGARSRVHHVVGPDPNAVSESDVRNNNVAPPRFRYATPIQSLPRRPPPVPKRSPNTRLTGLTGTASCSALNSGSRRHAAGSGPSPCAPRKDRKVCSSNRNLAAKVSPQGRQRERKFDVCAELLKYLSELTQELMAETSFTEARFAEGDAARKTLLALTAQLDLGSCTTSVATQTETPGPKWSQTGSKTFETIERLLREGSIEGVDEDPPVFKPPPPPTTTTTTDDPMDRIKRRPVPGQAAVGFGVPQERKEAPSRKPPPPPSTGSVHSKVTSLEAAASRARTGRGALLAGSVPILPNGARPQPQPQPRHKPQPVREDLGPLPTEEDREMFRVPRPAPAEPVVGTTTKGTSSAQHRDSSCGTSCSCLCLKYQSPCQSPSPVSSSSAALRRAPIPEAPAQPSRVPPCPYPVSGTKSILVKATTVSSRSESVTAPSGRVPGEIQRVNLAYDAVIAEIQAAIRHRSLAIDR